MREITPFITSPRAIKVELSAPLAPTSTAPEVSKNVAECLDKIEGNLQELEEDEGGVFDWLSKTVNNSKFLSNVAGKAKAGMDTVLTTLDPGMVDVLQGDGSFAVAVASEDPQVAGAVRRGFEKVFASVSVQSLPLPRDESPLVEGAERARTQCEARVARLLESRLVSPSSPLLAHSSFLHYIAGSAFVSSSILLQHKEAKHFAFSQPLPVDEAVLLFLRKRAREEKSPPGEFPLSVSKATIETTNEGKEAWNGTVLPFSSSDFFVLPAAVLASLVKRDVVKTTPHSSH